MKIKVSSFHCKKILFSPLSAISIFYTTTLFLLHRKNLLEDTEKLQRRPPKDVHGCFKKSRLLGYLLENLEIKPFRPMDPIMKALASL